jgi:hypothetical protein
MAHAHGSVRRITDPLTCAVTSAGVTTVLYSAITNRTPATFSPEEITMVVALGFVALALAASGDTLSGFLTAILSIAFLATLADANSRLEGVPLVLTLMSFPFGSAAYTRKRFWLGVLSLVLLAFALDVAFPWLSMSSKSGLPTPSTNSSLTGQHFVVWYVVAGATIAFFSRFIAHHSAKQMSTQATLLSRYRRQVIVFIALYLILGTCYSVLYKFFFVLDSQAFSPPALSAAQYFHLSLTLLTGSGSSPLEPTTTSTQWACSSESVVGVLFVVVYFAFLFETLTHDLKGDANEPS